MNEAALYQAYRDAQGTDREEQAYAELRAALHVNEPPAGWTADEDRREELLAESEHLAIRRTAP
jgi:hypothetical protein